MLKPGMILNERYEIVKVIGEGGMAVVYKGIDHKLHRDVAIKVLRPELSADEVVVSKFRKEGLNAASLSHNNIVGVYDLGRQNGSDYIVMEYIDGITLKEYIERRKKLTNDEIFKIAVKIADALKAAHASGIIHRDIKPQNIMVTPKGVVKVTDFGIAKATSTSTMTAQNEAMGSVHYFSPEQARGQKVDMRSDLYALGITMFEMATNALPFEGDTAVATAMKQIHDPLPDIQALAPDIWPGMAGIIRKLTNKQPEDRYQNADELLEDLKRVYQNHNYMPDNQPQSAAYTPAPAQAPQQIKVQKPARRFDPDEDDDEDEDEDEEPVRRVGFWIGITAALLALAAIVGLLLKFYLNDDKGLVSVPSLIGYTEAEAEEKVTSSGYNLVIEAQRYNDEYEKGKIYEQTPVAGTKAEPGATITVVLSAGHYDVTRVPDCSDMTYADVVNNLVELGIPYEVETQVSETVEMGYIIGQEPEEGTAITDSTVLKLIVSLGGENEGVEVPDLRGMTREEASQALKAENLTLGEVSLSYHDTVPAGQVIAQDLDAKSLVTEGTAVNVTISQGTPDEEIEEDQANGSLFISDPLPADKEEGRLSINAIDSNGNSSGLFDQMITHDDFADGGMSVSYPDGTVKIRVYLDGTEVFVRDIN